MQHRYIELFLNSTPGNSGGGGGLGGGNFGSMGGGGFGGGSGGGGFGGGKESVLVYLFERSVVSFVQLQLEPREWLCLADLFIVKKRPKRMCVCSETSWCPHFLSCFQVWETVSREDVQATWGVEWGSVARWAVAITAHSKISDQPTCFHIILLHRALRGNHVNSLKNTTWGSPFICS